MSYPILHYQISLNEGAHQLRLYSQGPNGTDPFSERCLRDANVRIIPCASLLVRITKVPRGPRGKPLEVNLPALSPSHLFPGPFSRSFCSFLFRRQVPPPPLLLDHNTIQKCWQMQIAFLTESVFFSFCPIHDRGIHHAW